MHHLRRVRVPVPGRHPAPPVDRRAAKRGATNTGQWEDPYGTKLFLALEKNGNALGLSAMERDKFIKKQEFPLFDGSAGVLPLARLHGRLRPQRPRDHRRLRPGDAPSRHDLRRSQEGEVHRRSRPAVWATTSSSGRLAEAGLKAFDTSKVRKIVAICPHCVRTIATDWREYGIAPEIEHHSEFMARHADRLPKQDTGDSIVYHDPCYLGRYQDKYEQPRAVVSLAGELMEAPRHHERSFCCGAGGGLAFLGEEGGTARVSHVRATELAATGAKTVGTACPFCNTMFRDALSAAVSDAPLQLLDIAQLTARALPPVTAPLGG